MQRRKNMKEKIKGFILPTIATVLFVLLYFYFTLPAINLRAFGFWAMIILAVAVFIGVYVSFTDETLIPRVKAWMKSSIGNAAQNAKTKNKYRGDYVVGKNIMISMGFSAGACNADIDELALSVRSYNALRRANIITIGELIEQLNEGELKTFRNLGVKSISEIKTKIMLYGFEQLSEKGKTEFFQYLIEKNNVSLFYKL